MHDFLKQSIDFLLINCLHEQVNAATMEQSSEMLNSILKWNHSNKIRKLTNKNKVRQNGRRRLARVKKNTNNFHFNKIKISFNFLKKTAGKVPEQEK